MNYCREAELQHSCSGWMDSSCAEILAFCKVDIYLKEALALFSLEKNQFLCKTRSQAWQHPLLNPPDSAGCGVYKPARAGKDEETRPFVIILIYCINSILYHQEVPLPAQWHLSRYVIIDQRLIELPWTSWSHIPSAHTSSFQ